MFDHSETVNVVSRGGRGNMWCSMEPKCRSMTLSPEKVSSLISGYIYFGYSKIHVKLGVTFCHLCFIENFRYKNT